MSIRGNEVITNTGVPFLGWSKRKLNSLDFEIRLSNEGMDKYFKHQPFGAHHKNWDQLMRDEVKSEVDTI